MTAHGASPVPVPKSCSTGSTSSSLSMASSSWRGGSICGGGGGGGGGLGMAICSVVLPWVSGSGVRERSGVTSTGIHPSSPASSSTHAAMSPAVTSARPLRHDASGIAVADDDPDRELGDLGHHGGGRGVLLLEADDPVGVLEHRRDPAVGVPGCGVLGDVVEALVDELVADRRQLRPAAVLALDEVGGQVAHRRRQQLQLLGAVDRRDRRRRQLLVGHVRDDGRADLVRQAVGDAAGQGDGAGQHVHPRIEIAGQRQLARRAGGRAGRTRRGRRISTVCSTVVVPSGSGSSSSGSWVSTGTNSAASGSRSGSATVQIDAVVVAHHGDRPAVDRRVAGDDEHDVVATLVLQRRLDLDERAGHGERIERRHLVAAQVEALVGLGQREARPEDRRGERRRRRRPPRRASGGCGWSTRRRRRTRRRWRSTVGRRASRWPTVIRASVPARIPAPWSSASQRSSIVNSRLRARARIGPIAGRPGRRECRAISPPTAAANQATVNGSARSWSVMSAGGALESRSAQPSTRPRANVAYAPGVGTPLTATPPSRTKASAERATLSPSSSRRHRAYEHDGGRADRADRRRRGEAPARTARCGSRSRRSSTSRRRSPRPRRRSARSPRRGRWSTTTSSPSTSPTRRLAAEHGPRRPLTHASRARIRELFTRATTRSRPCRRCGCATAR